jgi:hypothetical protein
MGCNPHHSFLLEIPVMSIVSNVHALVPFTSGKSEPFTGQRLAKVTCKQTDKMTKAGKKALPSVCASVPFLPLEQVKEHTEALLPHLVSLLQDTQDGIIRSLYEGSKGARKDVRQEEIDIPACVAFLNAKEAGSRLSGESIRAWFFDSSAKGFSALIIMDALKYGQDWDALTEEQQATVSKHVHKYAEGFELLAGKKVSRAVFSDMAWRRMGEVLELCASGEDQDAFAERLQERMAVVAKEVPVSEEWI